MNRKQRLGLLAVALLILAGAGKIPGLDRLLPASGPVTRVVLIHESADVDASLAGLIGGQTARALRDKGLWRKWDKDSIPAGYQVLLEDAPSLPRLFVLHGTRVTWSGPPPADDASLADLIAKQGGMP